MVKLTIYLKSEFLKNISPLQSFTDVDPVPVVV